MTSFVPNCARFTTATPSFDSHLNDLISFLGLDAVYFTLIDSVADEWLIMECTKTGARTSIQSVTGGVETSYDPDGGIKHIASLAADASTAWSGVTSFDWSNFDPVSTISNFAEMDDCFYWLLQSSEGPYFSVCISAGHHVVPDNLNDPAIGVTGEAVIVGKPYITTGNTAYLMLTGHSARHSLIRIGHTAWAGCEPTASASFSNDAGIAAGNLRLPPLTILADAEDEVEIGRTKYIRLASDSENPMSVLPAQDSNQGWLHIREQSSTSSALMLWDKTVPV